MQTKTFWKVKSCRCGSSNDHEHDVMYEAILILELRKFTGLVNIVSILSSQLYVTEVIQIHYIM